MKFNYIKSTHSILKKYLNKEIGLGEAEMQLQGNRENIELDSDLVKIINWMDEIVGISENQSELETNQMELKLKEFITKVI